MYGRASEVRSTPIRSTRSSFSPIMLSRSLSNTIFYVDLLVSGIV